MATKNTAYSKAVRFDQSMRVEIPMSSSIESGNTTHLVLPDIGEKTWQEKISSHVVGLTVITFVFLCIVLSVTMSVWDASQPDVATPRDDGSSDNSDLIQYRRNFVVSSPYNHSSYPFSSLFMPLYASHSISTPNANITSAIINIHGYTRNAGKGDNLSSK